MSEALRVVAVAVRHRASGLVLTLPQPARHHSVLHAMNALGLPVTRAAVEQGFLLSDGHYTWRRAARTVADEAGQILPGKGTLDELFSEDLW